MWGEPAFISQNVDAILVFLHKEGRKLENSFQKGILCSLAYLFLFRAGALPIVQFGILAPWLIPIWMLTRVWRPLLRRIIQ